MPETPEKFSLNGLEIAKGAPFFRHNRGELTPGHIGSICTHDKEQVNVVFDAEGNEVCAVRADAKVTFGESTVVFTTGEQSAFAVSL